MYVAGRLFKYRMSRCYVRDFGDPENLICETQIKLRSGAACLLYFNFYIARTYILNKSARIVFTWFSSLFLIVNYIQSHLPIVALIDDRSAEFELIG